MKFRWEDKKELRERVMLDPNIKSKIDEILEKIQPNITINNSDFYGEVIEAEDKKNEEEDEEKEENEEIEIEAKEIIEINEKEIDEEVLDEIFKDLCNDCPDVFAEKIHELYNEIKEDPWKHIEFRNKHTNPPKFMTKYGLLVRSKIEKIIADFYYDCNLEFEYEKGLIVGGEPFTPDFHLKKHLIFHEHFGGRPNESDEDYEKRISYKEKEYDSLEGIKWFYTTREDEENIEKVISKKLKEFGVYTARLVLLNRKSNQ